MKRDIIVADPVAAIRDFHVAQLDSFLYFDNHRNMEIKLGPANEQKVSRYAEMFSAMGAEPRLRIVRLLLAAHPGGMVVNEIGDELQIASSTLSHHLDKLKNEDLVEVRREGTFLRYSANTRALAELLGFLYAECCTRNKAVEPQRITCCK
ncbi:MAG TPA: metalloregulator ArsR/SmtB family transcription factor [Candidatus Angelobacter sp.]